ncbi:MAG TPA: MinD/ParA family protein, partial [Chloroflexia bacterium]
MAQIISLHSFRGGTGKSNTTANLATLLAGEGRRVGVIDTDIQSPGIHVLFGLRGPQITYALNDYLWGRCSVADIARPVLQDVLPDRLFLIPSSIKADDIVQVIRQGYDVRRLTMAFRELIDHLHLDVLLIDTHPGLNEETLFALAISTTLAIVLRPDQQDYEGTGVAVEVARS